MSSRLKPGTLRLVWIVYWIALFAVMHTPRTALPKVHTSNLDKFAHVTGYLLLGLFCGVAALRANVAIGRSWFTKWIVIFGMYAAFDELTQPLVNRSADVADWVFDMIGLTVAMVLVSIDAGRAVRERVD